MITFDALTLKAFVLEQKTFILGAKISKIQQPNRKEFVFTLRNHGVSRLLYINIDPQFYHVCFIDERTYKKRLLGNPKVPPMFCMLLRKYIEASRIIDVNVVENERIVELSFESRNFLGENTYPKLVLELMGKHSNLILYDADTDVILGCAHNVGADKSRYREIYGGIPYVYPPVQLKSDILKYGGDVDYAHLSENFYMFSGAFASLAFGCSLDKLQSFVKLENISPAMSDDLSEYCLYKELLKSNYISCSSVNEMIDEYYSYHSYRYKLNSLRTSCRSIVAQKLSKVSSSLSKIEQQLSKYKKGDKYRLYGDLLMANLYNLVDYSKFANVFDYENQENIEIPLDSSKTVKDNANKFYKLYNKSKNALVKLAEHSQLLIGEKSYLEELLYFVESCENVDELNELTDEITQTSTKNNLKVSEIKFIEIEDGSRIYIGKNNKQNDYIVSKLASDDDMWFHVRNNAGSHVLLKTKNLTDELILKCAQIAKENSGVKNSSKIGVIYTKRKYLKKPPGAALGYVTYRNEKEIILD